MVDIHSPWDNSHSEAAKNIIVGPATYSLLDKGFSPADLKSRFNIIDSNIMYCNGAQPGIVQWLNRGTSIFTWAQWQAGGLDAHSIVADPMFIDTAKGDYRVQAGSPALAMGFINFPMDSFGAMPAACEGIPMAVRDHAKAIAAAPSVIIYANGRLTIADRGEYSVAITTPAGRTVVRLRGKNNATFTINRKSFGAGIYIAIVKSKNSMVAKRIVVN